MDHRTCAGGKILDVGAVRCAECRIELVAQRAQAIHVSGHFEAKIDGRFQHAHGSIVYASSRV